MSESTTSEMGESTVSRSREKTRFDRETLHEAGHLWMAAALGLPVSRFEINPDRGRGKTSIFFGLYRGGEKKQRRSRELRIVANAGFAVEAVAWGLYSPPDSKTDREAHDLEVIERIAPFLERNMEQVRALAHRVYADGRGTTLKKKGLKKLSREGLLPQPFGEEDRVLLGL